MKMGIIERSDWQNTEQVLFTTDKAELEKKWAELKGLNGAICFADKYGQEHIRVAPSCGGLSSFYGTAHYKKFSNL